MVSGSYGQASAVGFASTQDGPRGDPPVQVRLESWSTTAEREWDALATSVHAAPFVFPGWTRAWSDAYHGGERPLLLTARRGAALTGVLPVLKSRGVLRSATHRETPLFEPVTTGQAEAAALVTGALATASRRLDLGTLWADGPVGRELLAQAAQPPLAVTSQLVGHSPYTDVDLPWADYEQKRAARKRQELRRRWRRLAEHGQLTFEVVDGLDGDLTRWLDEGFAVEGSGWKSHAGTAIVSSAQKRQFFTETASWAAAAGFLQLAFLRLSGRVVAFSYNLRQSSSLYCIKTGYDPAFSSCSPGALLTMRILEHACADPAVRRVEMLGKDDAHKLSWADGTRDRVRVVAFTNRWSARAERSAVRAGFAAREGVLDRVPRSAWAKLSRLHVAVTGRGR